MRARFILAAALVATPQATRAAEGVIEINQARVLAGGITPGDAPGFPATLSRSGSYRLTSNLATESRNLSGIEVTEQGVSIDLNGFTIACHFAIAAIPQDCLLAAGSGDGIVAAPGVERTRVRNGTIRGMGRDGVHVGQDSRVEQVQSFDNLEDGIETRGYSSITGCHASNNGAHGIYQPTFTGGVFGGNVVTGCLVDSNAAGGIRLLGEGRNAISGNVVSVNGGAGIAARGVIADNSLFRNDVGVSAASGSTLRGNAVAANTGLGFDLTCIEGGCAGYAENVLQDNGDPQGPQVSGGIEIGENACGPDTSCP
jgi:parallel beta-helix repeat protein